MVAESLEETPSFPGRSTEMSKVFSALAVSVEGYITGRDPLPGEGSATAGCSDDSGRWPR
jgi:hypothetical protein